jgi:sugar-phosphatase
VRFRRAGIAGPLFDSTNVQITCAAILFDLDGVLVDSHAVVERTWLRWMARHQLNVPGLVARAHGRRAIETVRDVAPDLDAEAEAAWLTATELADTQGLVALPGAIDAVAALPDDRRAIVTSGGQDLARLRLRETGVPVPRILVSADDVKEGKPSPEGYRTAARMLGLPADACVVFEDSPAGIAAGHAAGATVIALATTFSQSRLTQAHHVVANLAELAVTSFGGSVTITRRSG